MRSGRSNSLTRHQAPIAGLAPRDLAEMEGVGGVGDGFDAEEILPCGGIDAKKIERRIAKKRERAVRRLNDGRSRPALEDVVEARREGCIIGESREGGMGAGCAFRQTIRAHQMHGRDASFDPRAGVVAEKTDGSQARPASRVGCR